MEFLIKLYVDAIQSQFFWFFINISKRKRRMSGDSVLSVISRVFFYMLPKQSIADLYHLIEFLFFYVRLKEYVCVMCGKKAEFSKMVILFFSTHNQVSDGYDFHQENVIV